MGDQQQQLADSVFEIVFEKESAIFHDSDHVTGIVLINNKRNIAYRCMCKIQLSLYAD